MITHISQELSNIIERCASVTHESCPIQDILGTRKDIGTTAIAHQIALELSRRCGCRPLVLRVWRESSEIVRCAIHHSASGATAYIQGNEQINGLLQALRLELGP